MWVCVDQQKPDTHHQTHTHNIRTKSLQLHFSPTFWRHFETCCRRHIRSDGLPFAQPRWALKTFVYIVCNSSISHTQHTAQCTSLFVRLHRISKSLCASSIAAKVSVKFVCVGVCFVMCDASRMCGKVQEDAPSAFVWVAARSLCFVAAQEDAESAHRVVLQFYKLLDKSFRGGCINLVLQRVNCLWAKLEKTYWKGWAATRRALSSECLKVRCFFFFL